MLLRYRHKPMFGFAFLTRALCCSQRDAHLARTITESTLLMPDVFAVTSTQCFAIVWIIPPVTIKRTRVARMDHDENEKDNNTSGIK
jgi:hypothetical protein